MDELFSEVKKEFALLKLSKKQPSQVLKSKVVKLLDNYSREHITDLLGIKSGTLSNWLRRNKSPDFINLQLEQVNSPSPFTLKLSLANGVKLELSNIYLEEAINFVIKLTGES